MEDTHETLIRLPIHLSQPDKVRLVGFSLTLRQFAIMAVAIPLAALLLLPAYAAWGFFGLLGVGLGGAVFGLWAFQPIEGRYLEGWARALWQYAREPRELVWEREAAPRLTPKQRTKGPAA